MNPLNTSDHNYLIGQRWDLFYYLILLKTDNNPVSKISGH